jgi:hypothetical protein
MSHMVASLPSEYADQDQDHDFLLPSAGHNSRRYNNLLYLFSKVLTASDLDDPVSSQTNTWRLFHSD